MGLTIYSLKNLGELASSQPFYAECVPPAWPSTASQYLTTGLSRLAIESPLVRIECEVADFSACLEAMRKLPLLGWTVAPVFQSALEPALDELGDSSQRLGGVDTVVCDGGQWLGFQTIGEAWVEAVRETLYLDVRDLKIMIVGTGPLGQTLALQAASESCERLVLTDAHSLENAHSLVSKLKQQFVSERLVGAHDRIMAVPFEAVELTRQIDVTDLLINASGIGSKPTDPALMSDRLFQPHLCVLDMIAKNTRFQESARKAGARVSDGCATLLHQARLQLQLWTGQSISSKQLVPLKKGQTR